MLLNSEQIKLIENWITGLRSGNYKQGSNKLGSDAIGYCCLGVECKVNKIPFLAYSAYGPWEKGGRDKFLGFVEYFDPASNFATFQGDRKIFAHMNDIEQLTFLEIADILDFYLEVVRIEDEVERDFVSHADTTSPWVD